MSTPAPTQKALMVTSFPGPVALGERPIPQEVGDGEILVKILASKCPPAVYLSLLTRANTKNVFPLSDCARSCSKPF